MASMTHREQINEAKFMIVVTTMAMSAALFLVVSQSLDGGIFLALLAAATGAFMHTRRSAWCRVLDKLEGRQP